MPSIELDAADMRGLLRALDNLGPDRLVQPELEGLAIRIIDVTCVYPPPVTGTTRTGHLGRSWSYQTQALQMVIRNAARYAGYVQGPEQRDYHAAHGWQTLADVAQVEIDQFVQHLGDQAEKVWRQ